MIENDRVNERNMANDLFDTLFPICRSITGPGIRESFDVLKDHMPLRVHEIPSGTKTFDWTIPPEWVCHDAYIEHESGQRFAEFSTSNLHVLNFSTPIDQKIRLEELKSHITTIPDLPTAVPYATSYYQRNWGFCMAHNDFLKLPKGDYHVVIRSKITDGVLNYAETTLNGESEREILLTSYLCHPSLANNELSGPLGLYLLYNRIKKWKKRRHRFRFYIGPETIGSIAYLSRQGQHLIDKLSAGIILTCIGGPEAKLSYKCSRKANTLPNKVAAHLATTKAEQYAVRSFSPLGGSDERQFCSPGFNLPMGQFARTVYGQYDGYHNSLDDKAFMNIDAVIDSVDRIETFLKYCDISDKFVNLNPYCEPQLGKRKLYPNINSVKTHEKSSSDQKHDGRQFLNAVLILLSECDGKKDMIDIMRQHNIDFDLLSKVIDCLEQHNLLKQGSTQ